MARTKKPAAIVTRESLNEMIQNQPQERIMHVIGRALVALLARQTASERARNDTEVHNDIGFSGADARGATLTAKYYQQRKFLMPWQIEAWTRVGKTGFPRICKYAKQLNEIALEKQRAEAEEQQARRDAAVTHQDAKLENLRYELGMVMDSDDEQMISAARDELHAYERSLGIALTHMGGIVRP